MGNSLAFRTHLSNALSKYHSIKTELREQEWALFENKSQIWYLRGRNKLFADKILLYIKKNLVSGHKLNLKKYILKSTQIIKQNFFKVCSKIIF